MPHADGICADSPTSSSSLLKDLNSWIYTPFPNFCCWLQIFFTNHTAAFKFECVVKYWIKLGSLDKVWMYFPLILCLDCILGWFGSSGENFSSTLGSAFTMSILSASCSFLHQDVKASLRSGRTFSVLKQFWIQILNIIIWSTMGRVSTTSWRLFSKLLANAFPHWSPWPRHSFGTTGSHVLTRPSRTDRGNTTSPFSKASRMDTRIWYRSSAKGLAALPMNSWAISWSSENIFTAASVIW